MATIVGPLTDTFRAAQRGPPPESVAGSAVNLGTSQTANEDSTNTADRGNLTSGGFLRLVTTVGSTPTITGDIRGSVKGTGFSNNPPPPVRALRDESDPQTWTNQEKADLIRWAIADLWPRVSREIDQTATVNKITLVAGTYFYALPAGILAVSRVRYFQ